MDLEIRRITTVDEAEQSRRLAQEAFGMPAQPDAEPARVDAPGASTVAAFDGPVMAARMTDRAYDSWFGGRLVPTSGIGGVTVAMEYRGRKLLQPMFAELFAIARERGAVISALYPSASAIYRRLGYEVICTAEPVCIPISALSRVRRPDRVSTRRATAADVPAIKQAYDVWAGGAERAAEPAWGVLPGHRRGADRQLHRNHRGRAGRPAAGLRQLAPGPGLGCVGGAQDQRPDRHHGRRLPGAAGRLRLVRRAAGRAGDQQLRT